MTRAPDEKYDLELVGELCGSYGVEAVRFAKKEMRVGKTPDFRLLIGSDLYAFCEVKSPRDEWLDNLLDDAEPDEIVGGLRNDPIFNRLSTMITTAVKQFDAVNPDRLLPNVLVFVNHDDNSHFSDLQETLTGMFHADDGTRYATMLNVSEGRIREMKSRIDLYVWIDGRTKRVCGKFFSDSNRQHHDTLYSVFGEKEAKIR